VRGKGGPGGGGDVGGNRGGGERAWIILSSFFFSFAILSVLFVLVFLRREFSPGLFFPGGAGVSQRCPSSHLFPFGVGGAAGGL